MTRARIASTPGEWNPKWQEKGLKAALDLKKREVTA